MPVVEVERVRVAAGQPADEPFELRAPAPRARARPGSAARTRGVGGHVRADARADRDDGDQRRGRGGRRRARSRAPRRTGRARSRSRRRRAPTVATMRRRSHFLTRRLRPARRAAPPSAASASVFIDESISCWLNFARSNSAVSRSTERRPTRSERERAREVLERRLGRPAREPVRAERALHPRVRPDHRPARVGLALDVLEREVDRGEQLVRALRLRFDPARSERRAGTTRSPAPPSTTSARRV